MGGKKNGEKPQKLASYLSNGKTIAVSSRAEETPVRPQIDSTDLLAQTASAAAAADGFTSSSLTAVEDNNSDGGAGSSSNEWHDHQQATDHISVIPNIATATTTTLQTTVGNALAQHMTDSHIHRMPDGKSRIPRRTIDIKLKSFAFEADCNASHSNLCTPASSPPTHNALESHVEADMEMVDNAYCEDYGLSIPDTFERARCFGRNTAIQKREVKCRYANGTEAANAVVCHSVRLVGRSATVNVVRVFGVWSRGPSAMRSAAVRVLNTAFYSVLVWHATTSRQCLSPSTASYRNESVQESAMLY
ncbi:unnamed protein product [Ceratitis capitata]|uniref:(Mediterranean fruit fly) hypothetical protein n=1 Tax=Ceratitis capitata TaxID=7213 RepID=A0A811UG15_CERCA|nr:unnamed protein product [Ceratitis capitata]